MDSKCKYFGSILLIFLVSSRAVSLPTTKNERKCETLNILYPPKFNLNDILNKCNNKDLNDALLLRYCTELSLVRNEISSCGLGSVLEEVSSNKQIYMEILSKSQNIPMTENQDICEVFENLNGSLYKVYLDEPGSGKQIAGPFCPLFCSKYGRNYCEMLLRTYWIKKVFQDFKEAANQANTMSDTSVRTSIPVLKTNKHSEVNPADPEMLRTNIPPVAEAEQESPKAEPNDKVSGAVEQSKVTPPIVQKMTEPELPGGTEAQKETSDNISKPEVHVPTTNGNKPLGIHKTTLDSNLHLNDPKTIQNDQKDLSNFKSKEKINGKIPDDSSKSKTEDPSLKAKPIDPVSVASETKTKPNDPVDTDVRETKVKTAVTMTAGSETKEIPPPPIIEPSENEKNEGNDNLDGHIPVVPDKTMDGDMATNLERDTEHGNQMRDFGDGYAVNEYQDAGPPDESEMPLPDEKAQPITKDDDKNLQPDETGIGKQANDVPQVSAFPEEESGHFFAYFLTIVVFCIAGYLVFHNKQKIIALIIEGRHERRRRPNNGSYKRLDSKDGAKATSHVIF